jgi:DNA-binding beta-propeller fold protein YncE
MKLACRPVLGSALAAGIAAAALTVSGVAATVGPARAAAAPEKGLRVVAAIDPGGAPSSMVMAAGSLWVSLGVDGIARIDPATNTVVARIRPGGIALAAGFGSIWAIDVFFDELLRIDPETNRISDRIPVGGLPTAIAIGHGSVWVANQLDATVSRVSPTTGRTIATIPLDAGAIWPGAMLSTAAGIWVVAQDGMVVNRIRPQTATVDLRVPIPYARTLAAAFGSVWVGVANSASLVRITDGKAASVALTGRRADGYGPQLAGGSSLWLAVPGSVARVRPEAGQRLGFRLPADHRLSAITVAGDIWVADHTSERILRLADASPRRTP